LVKNLRQKYEVWIFVSFTYIVIQPPSLIRRKRYFE
jgi:hypothetical protein